MSFPSSTVFLLRSTLFCPDLDLDLDLVCVSPLILCWVVLCGVPQHGGSELSTDQVAFWFEIAEKSVGRPVSQSVTWSISQTGVHTVQNRGCTGGGSRGMGSGGSMQS